MLGIDDVRLISLWSCVWACKSQFVVGRVGTGQDRLGRVGTGRDGTGWDGTGWDGMGRDGTGWDEIGG